MQTGQYTDETSVSGVGYTIIIIKVIVVVNFCADAEADIGVYNESVPGDLAAQQELDGVDVFIAGVFVFGTPDIDFLVGVKYLLICKDGLKVGTLGACNVVFLGDEVPAEAGTESESSPIDELFCADIWFFLADIYFPGEDVIGVICVDTGDTQFKAQALSEFLFNGEFQLIDQPGGIYLNIGRPVKGLFVLGIEGHSTQA